MTGDIFNAAGERLDYRFHEAAAPAKAPGHLILIGHGVTANLDRPFLKALAEGLAAAGFHALRFSYSGNGASGGDFRASCITKEVEDLGCVIDAATAAGYEVSYVGHSMGGAVGVLRAARDPRLKLLVSLAGMVETKRFVEAEFGSAVPDEGFMWDEPECPLSSVFVNDLKSIGSTIPAAKNIAVPLLLVHGRQDDLVPVEESRALFGSGAGNPGGIVELNADHVFSGEATDAMVREVVLWFTERLATPDPA